MAHLISKPAIMVLCCLLHVVLSAVYPVAAVQAGVQARLDTGTEAGAVTSGPCSGKDITITQSPSAGISEFKVEIFNNCNSGCPPSNIHVSCGEFASAELVNPDTFKRVAVNDCLVNRGKALPYGTVLSFKYANSFKYPLSFKSATFC